MKRPKWEEIVKQYLITAWDAQVTDGYEADDAMGFRQCELSAEEDNSVICTIDKDLDQVPGGHYNFVKKQKYYISDEEGTRFFYYQMLIGDSTDGIKGVVGIGKAKAEKLLQGMWDEATLFRVVREAYSNDEEMMMNARCLWMWRKRDDDPLERFRKFDPEFCKV